MKLSNTTQKNTCDSINKQESITDYFQAVDLSKESLHKLCEKAYPTRVTRKKVAKLIDSQYLVDSQFDSRKDCEGTEEITQEENDFRPLSSIKTTKMTLNDVIKSPPTPHRITLCSENTNERQNGKMEVKNFQKPTVAPKARRKLNNNRLHITEDKSLGGNNHKLTDYFPVRRSVRKTTTTVLEEKQRCLEKTLRNNIEEGLKVTYFENKGRGIVADKYFKKGDFVVEYSGDLIDMAEAKKREEMYALDQNTGCYMYYFKHNNQQYCIDATPETDRLGRLVNHSRNGNLLTRSISVDGKPRLVLIAKEDIQLGEEVLYDYGDRSKESLKHHPWLAY
ncbi:hypothetical protein WA026_019857 [Henosepilachna vigintioctopunctata]|uniref:[histone H4]-lysine(20) N-methyltransferase n=1 Tax=Henosepilachna vigintioctopunctata TaxID=420089 RepID=A0AAW1V9P2_9CUCU